MMNLEEWKERFAAWQKKNKATVEWTLDLTGQIRTPLGLCYCSCPITAEFTRPSIEFPECAAALELDSSAASAILLAADKSKGCCASLRKWLLETCGIQESEAA